MKVDKNNIETMMSALKNDKKVDVKLTMLLLTKRPMTILNLENLKPWF